MSIFDHPCEPYGTDARFPIIYKDYAIVIPWRGYASDNTGFQNGISSMIWRKLWTKH